MNPAIHEILVKNDFVGEWWDGPTDVDFRQLEGLKPQIEEIVSRELDIDPHVEDATYLTDIGLLDERYYDRKTGTGGGVFRFALRFSCLGRMFTVHGTEWRERSTEWNIGRVISFLQGRGFVQGPRIKPRPNSWHEA